MDQYNIENVENTENSGKLSSVKRKTLKRSLVCALAFIVITIILFSAQTVAYFTSNVQSNMNHISTDKLDIQLLDTMINESGEQVAYTDPIVVYPATSYSKKISVNNAETLSAYVRIKLDITIDKNEQELPANWKDLIICDFNIDDTSTEDVIEGAWTYKDGYYYYNTALTSGQTTAPLFNVVTFSPAMGNQFKNTKITFTITADAVQSDFNGDNVFEALGW